MGVELDLATVNLWGLPWPVARERRARKRRFLAHVEATAYHVVGIQELWWPWRWTLRGAPLRLPHSPRDSGLAVAARLRLRGSLGVLPFRHHAGFDRVKRKGMLHAAVEATRDTLLSVFVTHLQTGRRHAAVRARQVDELLERLGRERGPSVLMGDFNLHGDVDEDHRSVERLQEAGLVDAAAAVGCLEPTWHSANPYVRSFRTEERFDRVYLRDGTRVRLEPVIAEVVRVRPRPFSDHHPLRVRVRLSG